MAQVSPGTVAASGVKASAIGTSSSSSLLSAACSSVVDLLSATVAVVVVSLGFSEDADSTVSAAAFSVVASFSGIEDCFDVSIDGAVRGVCDSDEPGRSSVEVRSFASPMTPSTSLRLAVRLGDAVMPPAAGSPSFSREARQVLYFIKGNRVLTSSALINFFSLLLLCGRGMAVRSIGSPSDCCPFRKARLRWLYRKQYLTPTMILMNG
jgi:hypothetical protein